MAADHGMLFEFDREAPVAFWMKNTYIPLDMIFIAPSGVVTHIAANAEPLRYLERVRRQVAHGRCVHTPQVDDTFKRGLT